MSGITSGIYIPGNFLSGGNYLDVATSLTTKNEVHLIPFPLFRCKTDSLFHFLERDTALQISSGKYPGGVEAFVFAKARVHPSPGHPVGGLQKGVLAGGQNALCNVKT